MEGNLNSGGWWAVRPICTCVAARNQRKSGNSSGLCQLPQPANAKICACPSPPLSSGFGQLTTHSGLGLCRARRGNAPQQTAAESPAQSARWPDAQDLAASTGLHGPAPASSDGRQRTRLPSQHMAPSPPQAMASQLLARPAGSRPGRCFRRRLWNRSEALVLPGGSHASAPGLPVVDGVTRWEHSPDALVATIVAQHTSPDSFIARPPATTGACCSTQDLLEPASTGIPSAGLSTATEPQPASTCSRSGQHPAGPHSACFLVQFPHSTLPSVSSSAFGVHSQYSATTRNPRNHSFPISSCTVCARAACVAKACRVWR